MPHKKKNNSRLFACVLLIAASTAIEMPMHFSPGQDVLIQPEATGRLLIWHEECTRVMDDPSVVNRYAFESLQQYLEYCIERTSKYGAVPSSKRLLAFNL